jgi:hypothetical protein
MKLFGLILLLFVPFASSFVIDCEFKIRGWAVINNIYNCEPKISPMITERGIVMTSASGNHHNDILTKMIQDMLQITSENTTVITQNFNQQLIDQQLSTQSKLNKLEVKIDQI